MVSSSSASAEPVAARGLGAGLRIDLFSIFPAELDAMCELSVLGRARRDGVVHSQLRTSPTGRPTPERGGARHLSLALVTNRIATGETSHSASPKPKWNSLS